jgi:hypothetical protein
MEVPALVGVLDGYHHVRMVAHEKAVMKDDLLVSEDVGQDAGDNELHILSANEGQAPAGPEADFVNVIG